MLLDQISSLFQVVLIDLVLAGDNLIVVGMVAATVAADKRRRVILAGIGMAALMRIGFALITVQLLNLPGLLFAGGLLLLWVAWKLWQDLRSSAKKNDSKSPRNPRTVRQAVFQIALADLSMSLDNVLAVAGVARDHPVILVFGLALSIVLMGVGATAVVRALDRYHWIGYAGLAVILYVALSMIVAGIPDLSLALS
jgi:YjbE family integral membrane protein